MFKRRMSTLPLPRPQQPLGPSQPGREEERGGHLERATGGKRLCPLTNVPSSVPQFPFCAFSRVRNSYHGLGTVVGRC